jgi:hypothetical protein
MRAESTSILGQLIQANPHLLPFESPSFGMLSMIGTQGMLGMGGCELWPMAHSSRHWQPASHRTKGYRMLLHCSSATHGMSNDAASAHKLRAERSPPWGGVPKMQCSTGKPTQLSRCDSAVARMRLQPLSSKQSPPVSLPSTYSQICRALESRYSTASS